MKTTQIIPFRRKREGKTNYKKRLALLKSKQLRVVIRKTNKQMLLQIVEYFPDGDKVLCGLNSSLLKKQGWNYSFNSLPACYLAGLMLGKKAQAKKISGAIADLGLQTPVAGSRLYAAIKGMVDAGLKIPVSEKAFPSEERLSGKHIADHFASNKDEKQYSKYKKEKTDASNISKDFEQVKNKLMK